MNVASRNARLMAAVMAVLSTMSAVKADNLLWDPNQAGSSGSDNTGTWDTNPSNTVWYDQTTGSGDVSWSNSAPYNSATFGNPNSTASGNGSGSYNVLLGAPITVQNITFGTAANGYYYNIADQGDGGETLTLAGDVIKASAVGASSIQVSSPINLTAGNHTFAINDTPGATPELSIENIVGGNAINGAGSITVDNSYNGTTSYPTWGTLVFNSANGYTGGTTITNGCLTDNVNGALGTGAVSIGALGNLEFGGNATQQNSSITVSNNVSISRNTYSGSNYSNYPDAIISNNTGNPAATVTFNGGFTIDSTDARIAANTSTITISSNLSSGPDVAANAAVLDLDGDYAGAVNLTGNNSAYGAAGGAIEIINGVELNANSINALGGTSGKLLLTGGTLHINSQLLASDPGFATNFGAATNPNINTTSFGTGVDVDQGLSFTVNNASGGGVGMRGGGTLNFTGTNSFSGSPYFDGVDDGPGEGSEKDTTATGFVNFESGGTTTMPSLKVRSATVNVAGTLNVGGTFTSIGVDSAGSNGTPDYGTVDISGTLDETTGDAFNVSDNGNTHGTINLGYNATAYNASSVVNTGTLTVGGVLYLGKSAGAVGTLNMVTGTTLNAGFQVFVGQGDGTGVFNQSGGTVNLTNNGNFTFVLDDGRGGSGKGSGTFNFSGGTFNSAGEVYVGEGVNGDNATWNQSGGTANLNDWFVVGRESAWGTVTMTGGTINHSGGGNMSLGDSVSAAGKADIIALSNNAAINDTANDDFIIGNNGAAAQATESGTSSISVTGQFWLGNGGGGVASLGLSGTSSLTVDNWLAVGRNGGTGTLNIGAGSTVTQAASNYFDIGGDGLTSNGTVNVNGGTLNAYQMLIGENGNGTAILNINSGSSVNLPSNTILANSGSVSGTINLNGGTLTAYGFQANNGVLGEGAGTGAAKFVFNGGTLAASTNNTAAFIGAKVHSVVSTGGAIINPSGYTVTINSALTHDSTLSGADGGLTVEGSGTLTINGTDTYTGNTSVNGATLVAGTNVALPSSTNVSIGSTGTLQLASGTGTNTVAGLTMAAGGVTDITNDTLNINYGSGASPLAQVANAVAYGAGVSGASNANGSIISSTANANNSSGNTPGKYTVGYADATENSSVPAQTVAVRYTLAGDADLNGTVNFNDYQALQNHYNQKADWSGGDFNHDGTVNFNDYLLLQNNYNQSVSVSSPLATTANSNGATSVTSKSVLMAATAVVSANALTSPRLLAATTNASSTTPTVTYILSINDNGSGVYTPGDYAVYAVDNTALGNAGIASFEINLGGVTTQDIYNTAPGGHYQTGSGASKKVYEVGFTQFVTEGQTPITASQDTVGYAQGSNVALVYGYGQASGNDATVVSGSTSLGDDNQPQYGDPLLLVTGDYTSGETPTFEYISGTNSDGANVFVTNSGYATEPATLAYETQTLSVPEPASLGLLGLAGLMALRRRRR